MKIIEDIREIQQIALNIAVTFDGICNSHQIRYYMLGGTMLGAIRHHGFIPWDDDMDFGVPREEYNKLINILEQELPYPYKVLSYKEKGYVYNFAKIVDTRTVAIEPSLESSYYTETGIFIDIFPLDFCEENDGVIKKVWNIRHRMGNIYIIPEKSNNLVKLAKRIRRFLWPISLNSYLKKADSCIANKQTAFLANVYGRWREKEIIPTEWYGNDSKYQFEGHFFNGIKEYDKYLSRLYGNYMQLPPADKRQIHIGKVFWK